MKVRFAEGFVPAGASLHALALSVSEYSPALVQDVHSVASPPIDDVPARQSPHVVSVIGEQEMIM